MDVFACYIELSSRVSSESSSNQAISNIESNLSDGLHSRRPLNY